MAKVLLATGVEDVDKSIAEYLQKNPDLGVQIVGETYFREAVDTIPGNYDVVVISEELPGSADFVDETIYKLRMHGARVVLLVGDEGTENAEKLIEKTVPLGVYDYLYNPVCIEKLIDKILNPSTLADVNLKRRPAAIKLFGAEDVVKKKTKEKNAASGTCTKLTILLATGDDNINESISTSVPCSALMSTSRESLIKKAPEVKPDVIILSYLLPGELDILEVIYQVKEITERVLFLSGNMPENDITVLRIREMGVEVLSGDASIGSIIRTTCRLSGIAEQQADETEEYQPQERVITRLTRVGTEFARSMPNISVPKIRISKKVDINEKLIAVVSPLPAGKTFVSVNLSTVLAGMGYNVALVDADARQQSIHAWLNMGDYETGLADAVNSNEPLINAFQHQMVPNLYVFSTDPYMERPFTANTKGLSHLFEALHEDTDIIIVDTSRHLNDPLNKLIIDTAASVLLVADMDYNHLLKLQAELDKLESTLDFNKFSLVVNRSITCDNIDASDTEKAAGLPADGIIPDKTKEALESIKNGIPAALFCLDIKNALMSYWERRLNC